MGENESKLNFRPRAGLTATQAAEGTTVYEATALGVRYEVEGYIIDTMAARPRRAFRAYRISGPLRRERIPAAEGGEHRTRAAAYAQAERDLAAVLAGRAPAVPESEAHAEATEPPLARMPAWGAIQSFLDIRLGDRVTVHGHPREWRVGRFYRHAGDFWATLGSGDDWAYVRASELTKVEQSTADDAEHANDLRTIEHLNLSDLRTGHDNVLRRIIARAKYDALREVLAQLDGWIEGQKSNHDALDHRGEGVDCWTRFDTGDIRNMVNDAARATGTREPWGGA